MTLPIAKPPDRQASRAESFRVARSDAPAQPGAARG
jgi:hypothetical protein